DLRHAEESSEGGFAPLPTPPRGRGASRRTTTGWAPCVRGEHLEVALAKPALERRTVRVRAFPDMSYSSMIFGTRKKSPLRSGALASMSDCGKDGRVTSSRITFVSGTACEVGSTPSVSTARSLSM